MSICQERIIVSHLTGVKKTKIELDEKILREAMELTKMKTKKDVVNFAISELVKKLKRKKMLELEGKIQWEENLNEMREGRFC